jgi:hypothetical protein
MFDSNSPSILFVDLSAVRDQSLSQRSFCYAVVLRPLLFDKGWAIKSSIYSSSDFHSRVVLHVHQLVMMFLLGIRFLPGLLPISDRASLYP